MLNPKSIAPAGPLPQELHQRLSEFAIAWYDSKTRPRVRPEVARHWDGLIAEWLVDARAPLFVRRSGDRGVAQRHPSGRAMVHVDNSPAHWTLGAALMDLTPSLDQLLDALVSGELPVTFALTTEERRKERPYAGLLGQSKIGSRINKASWKVCHIEAVGLGQRRNAWPTWRAIRAPSQRRTLGPLLAHAPPAGALGRV